MSLQDFALSILASLIAAIICTLAKYAQRASKRFLDANKSLGNRAIWKIRLLVNYFGKCSRAAVTLVSEISLTIKYIVSPTILSLVLCSISIIFPPVFFIGNRNTVRVVPKIGYSNGPLALTSNVETSGNDIADVFAFICTAGPDTVIILISGFQWTTQIFTIKGVGETTFNIGNPFKPLSIASIETYELYDLISFSPADQAEFKLTLWDEKGIIASFDVPRYIRFKSFFT